jgi:hypothetical protein
MKYPKTYFIWPTTKYVPDDLIQLGQVITDPRCPFRRLSKPLPLEGDLKPRTAPSTEWTATNTKTGESSVGVFAHAVSAIKAGISGSSSQNEAQTWEAARLETQFFELDEDHASPSYVDRTAKIPEVAQWLADNRRPGKTVYMITGLKIAKNPGKYTFDGSEASSLKADATTTVDPNQAVKLGAEASRQRSDAATTEEKPEVSFVFAYRLRKLKVTWRNNLKVDEYQTGGDLYSAGHRTATMDAVEKDVDDDASYDLEDVSAEKGDFGAGLPAKDKKLEAFDEVDGDKCLVIECRASSLAV